MLQGVQRDRALNSHLATSGCGEVEEEAARAVLRRQTSVRWTARTHASRLQMETWRRLQSDCPIWRQDSSFGRYRRWNQGISVVPLGDDEQDHRSKAEQTGTPGFRRQPTMPWRGGHGEDPRSVDRHLTAPPTSIESVPDRG